MLMFFRACRHHSTKSAKCGHLIPFVPLSASGGNCPLCPPPGSAASAIVPNGNNFRDQRVWLKFAFSERCCVVYM